MKFNKKKVLTISGIVLGVIVVLLVIVYFSLSLILKSSVQTFGSMVMGVPVTVDSIVLEPFKGALRINNLTVGNPDGYSSPHAFKLGKFEAAVVPSSLFGGDKMIIDKLATNFPIPIPMRRKIRNRRRMLKRFRRNRRKPSPCRSTGLISQTSRFIRFSRDVRIPESYR